jgi:outer membrane lipoprotein-sorting protein
VGVPAASHRTIAMRKLLLLLTFALLATSLSAQTADDVINNYIAARGGLAKIKAVKTQRVTGTVSFGPGVEGPFLVEHERPLKLHTELTLNDQTLILTYNGKNQGWIYNPFAPNPSVQPMSQADLAAVFDEADFDGPFVDYKSKGNQIQLIDKEEVLGKTAYKIKLTNKAGDVSSFFFDAESHLLLKWEGIRKIGDHDVPWEEVFHDFRDISGLKFAFLIESQQPGTDQFQKITAEKIEVNVAIDGEHFGKPNPPSNAPPAADAPAQSAKPN